MKLKKFLVDTFIFLLLIGALAWLLTSFLLYSQNTLLNNGNWISLKRNLEMFVFEADSFLITRSTLHQNSLHLERWGGYNLIVYKDNVNFKSFNVNFKISPRGYLDIIYSSTSDSVLGVRISRNEIHPSVFLKADKEGQFIEKHPIAISKMDDQVHQASLIQNGISLTLKIDGQVVSDNLLPPIPNSTIGFRSGMEPVQVIKLNFKEHSGREFEEDFVNKTKFNLIFFFHFILLSVLAGFSLIFLNPPIVYFVILNINFLVLILFSFDYYYWSNLQVDVYSKPFGISREAPSKNIPEKFRIKIFSVWGSLFSLPQITKTNMLSQGYLDTRIFEGPILCTEQTCEKIDQPALNNYFTKSKNLYRVLFIGTSQTVGSGAERLEDTFFVKIHKNISEHFFEKLQLESLNIGVSGSISSNLLKDYKQIYTVYKPDLVIINLSTNDNDPNLFQHNLEQFLNLNQKAHIATVMVMEANSDEGQTIKLHNMHEVMRQVATQKNTPLLDLNAYLLKIAFEDNGWLWWDICHMTSYGHAKVAEFLASEIENKINDSFTIGKLKN